MEELAATFQRELDKPKAEAEAKGELIQELEDIPEASTRNDDEEPSDLTFFAGILFYSQYSYASVNNYLYYNSIV